MITVEGVQLAGQLLTGAVLSVLLGGVVFVLTLGVLDTLRGAMRRVSK